MLNNKYVVNGKVIDRNDYCMIISMKLKLLVCLNVFRMYCLRDELIKIIKNEGYYLL